MRPYDDDDYIDEPELTDQDRRIMKNVNPERVNEDCIDEMNRLVGKYYVIRDMNTEKKADKQLQKEAMQKLQDAMDRLDFPTDSITYLYKLCLAVGKLRQKNGYDYFHEHILGGKDNDAEAEKSLPRRLQKYMTEHTEIYHTQEFYDVFINEKFEHRYNSSSKKFMCFCYDEIIKETSVKVLEVMLAVYNQERYKSDDYIAKVGIPNSSKEEFKAALKLMTGSERKEYYLKQRLTEMKEIVLRDYADDAELCEWTEKQKQEETKDAADDYNCTNNSCLGLSIVLIIIGIFFFPLLIAGVICVIIWALLFHSPLRNHIAYLRKGKEATKKAKEL